MKQLKIGELVFDWGEKTYVMGIINVTPDSFSGDGLLDDDEWITRALFQGQQFALDGADILDIGGESTRPGSVAVNTEEELRRVIPVIEGLVKHTNLPISIDTYKAVVAEAALDAGASMVNDVWGLRMDPKMANLCASRNVPIVIMHNRSRARDAVQEERLGGHYVGTRYDDLLADVASELEYSIDLARAAGIPDEHIIIDPGIGFGKTIEQNLCARF